MIEFREEKRIVTGETIKIQKGYCKNYKIIKSKSEIRKRFVKRFGNVIEDQTIGRQYSQSEIEIILVQQSIELIEYIVLEDENFKKCIKMYKDISAIGMKERYTKITQNKELQEFFEELTN